MPSEKENKPQESLQDKLRSFFGTHDPQKKQNALPPKAHFSIWYFLIALLLFSYLQQYFFLEKWRRYPTANLSNT
jgi:cell division protease FtsH